MLFSRACEYGLRAMLYLAQHEGEPPVRIRKVAEDLKVPLAFLAKIVHTLSRNNLIQSQKGPGGGVSIAHSSKNITMLQIVEVIDGLDFFDACVLGIPHCDDDFPCPLHEQWGSIRGNMREMLADRTLDKITDQLKTRGWILVRD
ncbi:MAG: Rrf2 family transcriptional regulator [Candidatus Latescibacteria bacterium]|jgi:Rrf2 family protein|nr:Rrf2 family transcriptional regulator [Candidatus Latescibacterota bacterium]